MAFVAQAAGRRIMCYATANVLRADADGMVPKFAAYWKEQTRTRYPAAACCSIRGPPPMRA